MSKQYKLLKDLPDADTGTVFTFTDEGDNKGYEGQGNRGSIWYRKDIVEQNTQWFEEIKPKIDVDSITLVNDSHGWYSYQFTVDQKIPEDKFDAIRKSVEFVINPSS